MHKLSSRQWTVLVLLTLVWGINWPIMKIGVTGFPPLSFRALCMWLGTPVLAWVLVVQRVPFRIGREHWRELLLLATFNMFFWHGLIIVAVQSLSSGRAAILGYTMPMFSAVLGALVFGDRLAQRAWGGVAAASLGVVLLLWHELSNLSGKPMGVLLIPVLGVFSGAVGLGEVLHWQNWAAVGLMMLSIAAVLWPKRRAI